MSPPAGTCRVSGVVGPCAKALPDRPGNRRGDSLHAIVDTPHAGLLHLIPGSTEALRINGRARVRTKAPVFDAMTRGAARPARNRCAAPGSGVWGSGSGIVADRLKPEVATSRTGWSSSASEWAPAPPH